MTLLLWLLTTLLAARFAWQTLGVMTRRSDGFAAYYTAARLVHSENAGPQLYDDAWFNDQVDHAVPGIQDIYSPNPPSATLLLLPLSSARYETARTIWILLTVVILAAALALIVRELRLRQPVSLIFVSVALASQPLEANMRQGQVYVLLLALATLVWTGSRRRRDKRAGFWLGLMLAVKTAGLALPILFILRKRWRALAWSALGGLAVSGLTLVWSGLNTWTAYLRVLPRLRQEPYLSVTAYQTTTSLFRHLFVFDATWNRAPLLDAPEAATITTLLVSFALLASTSAFVMVSGELDLSFAALFTLSVLLSPLSLDYHFTLLLLPFAIVLGRLQRTSDVAAWVVLGVAVLLVMSDLPYTSSRLSGGAWALLAYPKLAGTLLLWGVTMWLLRQAAALPTAIPLPTLTVIDHIRGVVRYARG